MQWKTNPFLKITFTFIIGILLNEKYKCEGNACYLLVLLVVLFFSFHTYLLVRSTNNNKTNLLGFVGFLSFILLGYVAAQLSFQADKPALSSDSFSRATFYKAIINSKPTATAKTTKYQMKIEQVKIDDKWVSINDNAILYFKENAKIDFEYGDRLLIKGKPHYLENQKNPYAFDYSLYLQRKGVYLNDFISKNDYIVTNANHKSSFKYLNLYIGDLFEQILSNNISAERELNLIKAMLLGRRDEITPEMDYVYSSSGTAHILAVSGLHVGIIYLIFSTLLRFLRRRKYRIIYFGITVCGIWSFAFITGLSPSVQRAAIMLSFILIAELLRRKSSIYNTISASAFFVLLYEPNLIFSVSFQLSYAAVFGIIFFYKKIFSLFFINNRILNFFWQITALSLSVQLATYPITIYYFHQFPLLFPLTNLLAIPTAITTIVGGLLILLSSPYPPLSGLIGEILEKWVYYYHEMLVSITRLPLALVDNLFLKPSYVFLIIICVVLLSSFLFSKRFYFFSSFTIAITVLSTLVVVDFYIRSHQQEIVFYHGNNNNYFDVYIGRNCYTNSMTELDHNESQVKFSISPNRRYHLIEHVYDLDKIEIVKKIGKNILIQWEGKSIFILSQFPDISVNCAEIVIDYLVVGKSLLHDFSNLDEKMKIRNLILDSTIDKATANKFLDKYKKSSLMIHSVSVEGAYKIDI